jgi:hypothetical protein
MEGDTVGDPHFRACTSSSSSSGLVVMFAILGTHYLRYHLRGTHCYSGRSQFQAASQQQGQVQRERESACGLCRVGG